MKFYDFGLAVAICVALWLGAVVATWNIEVPPEKILDGIYYDLQQEATPYWTCFTYVDFMVRKALKRGIKPVEVRCYHRDKGDRIEGHISVYYKGKFYPEFNPEGWKLKLVFKVNSIEEWERIVKNLTAKEKG